MSRHWLTVNVKTSKDGSWQVDRKAEAKE